MSDRVIYVDNNATTAVAPEVKAAMEPFLEREYGNPSSIHTLGGGVTKHIREARSDLAALIGAETPEEIIFTSCGSESDNTAIRSALETQPRKRHIVTTKVEHPAVLSLVRHLAARGYRVTEIPVDGLGRLDPAALEAAISDDTAIVSVMWANNETGVIFPIEEIGRICRKRGVLFHSDAVQAVGKVPIDLKNLPLDMLSLSGHKLHAPKGVGALYVRKGVRFEPYLIGGHQESNRRAGTENVAGIVALGKAAQLAVQYMDDENTRVRAMRDRLEAGLLATCKGARVNGDPQNRLPNTSNISFEYIEGEAILLHLDRYGICASSGSACTTGSLEPSHVLRAMGIPYIAAHGSIRLSMSRFNSEQDVDAILEVMPGIVTKLRELSPFDTEHPYFQAADDSQHQHT